MWHLLKSEVTRFGRLAIGFAIFHFIVLRLVAVAIPVFFSQDAARTSLGLLAYAILGLVFGLVQMGAYKRLESWTSLIHRPLPPMRIYSALISAGAVLITIVVALPWAAITLYLRFLSHQVIDSRQLLMMPFLVGLVGCFYLCGCVIILASTRFAIAVLVLPVFFLSFEIPGISIFAVQGAVLVWLTAIGAFCFKPDRSTPPAKALGLAAVAAPIQLAAFFILSFGVLTTWSLGVISDEVGLFNMSEHGWNDYFPAGTYMHTEYLDDLELLLHGLAESESEHAEELRGQLKLAQISALSGRRLAHFASRHQLMFQDRLHELFDEENERRWVFDHDEMLFAGRGSNGRPAGWLGPEGPIDETEIPTDLSRFDEVPYALGDQLMTAHRLWAIDHRRGRLDLRFEVSREERLSGVLQHYDTFSAILSDRALYLFDHRGLDEVRGLLEADDVVELPAELRNISRIHVAELLDGYLISVTEGDHSERGFLPARQVILELGLDGETTEIAVRDLSYGQSAWANHRGFIVSPLLRTLVDIGHGASRPWQERRVNLGDIRDNPPPTSIIALSIAVAFASSILGWLVTGTRRLSRRQRISWTLACLAIGPPCLLTVWCLTPKIEVPLKSGDLQRLDERSQNLALGWNA